MTPTSPATPEPIPHITTAKLPFDTPDELRDRWRALMGPLGFSEHLLWFAFVDEDRLLLPALNQLELEGPPTADLVALFMDRMCEVIELPGVVSVAMLLTRPGTDGVTEWDRSWARMLTGAAQVAGVAIEPIFRANAVDLVEVPVPGDRRRSVA